MDLPHPEEDVDIGLHPLDVVERVLMAENLSFDRSEDGDLAFTACRSSETHSCRQSASGRQANHSS